MRDGTKNGIFFIDAIEGNTREGRRVEISAKLLCDSGDRAEIDSLLGELGDDP